MQKYKDLEDKRFQGMQSSKEISRNKEIAENELEKLRAQQSRNELTVKERSTLHQNEINLQLRIDELQKSQQKKVLNIQFNFHLLELYPLQLYYGG